MAWPGRSDGAELDAPLWTWDTPPRKVPARKQAKIIKAGVLRGLPREAVNESRTERGLPPRDDRGLT